MCGQKVKKQVDPLPPPPYEHISEVARKIMKISHPYFFLEITFNNKMRNQ